MNISSINYGEANLFQRNTNRRLIKKLILSSNEKIRGMYQNREWITSYIAEMPLRADQDDEYAVHGLLQELKKQYIVYWSKILNLNDEETENLSAIWDSEINDRSRDPDIGRSVLYFEDGRKMTEDGFISALMKTFGL